MGNEITILNAQNIKDKILNIRGVQVMIDRDLAVLYSVETKVLNQAVKRNIARFPEEFRFQLTDKQKNELVTNCDRFQSLKHSNVNPYVFTEQGVSMLSAVLRSKTAIEVSIKVINAFVEMRNFIRDNAQVFARLDLVEKRQISFESETAKNFEKVFDALESKEIKPKQGIFFDGQIFDAYVFVSDLIKSAEKSIILIDNYVDETVLIMLSKRKEKCKAVIYTKNITKKLELDIKKHNEQYHPVGIKKLPQSHDRFLIIDNETVYHIGASLKDLGKKWFAFSKFESGSLSLLTKLKNSTTRSS